MPMSDNTRGAMLMIASMAAFSLGDACVKATGGQMPLSQLLVIRGVFASAAIALLAWRMDMLRWRFARWDWALIGVRSLAEVGAAFFFLTALFHMPLANLTALLQMLPLTVTLGSALFFKEAVGWRRWLAIAVGFIGMLMIVRPGTEGFSVHALYALIAVFCVTVRDLTTRRISSDAPSLTITLAASLAVLGFASLWSFDQTWVAITPDLGCVLGGATLFIIGGYTFSVMVMRVGDVGFVAPFRYTGLIWALGLGLVFFGEWPTNITLVGAAIIVATGVFTLWRETHVARRKAATDVQG